MKRAIAKEGKEDNNAFYIFNADNNNGFVIVSGDDRTEEILGYSDEGHIDLDNIPENLQAWLYGYSEQINELDRNPNVHKRSMDNKTAVKPLLQSMWSQRDPFNWMCPEIDGVRCPTGCVATAMAQVLYYFKCPQKETPEIPGYTTSTQGIELSTLPPTTFEWDKMKDIYGTFLEDNIIGTYEYNREEGEAVAKLMRYCGQAVRMDYTPLGSSAAVGSKTFQQYFGFSKTAEKIERKNFSTNEWEDIIYKEVSEGRPVMYEGYAKFGQGHQFVCDGYDGAGLFHINWGWGYGAHGFYLLSILGDNDFCSENYASFQRAIIGLQPATEEELAGKTNCYIKNLGWGIHYDQGLPRTSTEKDFDFRVYAIIYEDEFEKNLFYGDLGFGIYKDNALVDMCIWNHNPEYVPRTGNIEREWTMSFGANLEDGEYIFKILYKDNEELWKEAQSKGYLHVQINGLSLNVSFKKEDESISPILNTDCVINSITIDNPPLIINKEAAATISLTNTGESFEQHLYFYFGDYEYALTDGSAYLNPGQTGSIRVKFTPNFYGTRDIEIASNSKWMIGIGGERKDNPDYHAFYKESIYAYPNSNIYINDCYVVPGGDAEVSVYLEKRECDIKKAQFTISLPDGVSIQPESADNQNASISKGENGKWFITIDQINTENSLKLLSFTILADDMMNVGDYSVKIDNTEVISIDDEKIYFLPVDAKIRVGSESISSSNIHLTEAGTLSYYIQDKYGIEELKISGEINGSDLRLIRDMGGNNCFGELTNGKLKVLDISEARIVAGGEMYLDTDRIKSKEPNNGGFTGSCHLSVTDNDVLPEMVFCNLNLTEVQLPETLKSIDRIAFSGCKELNKLTIPSSVTSIGRQAFSYCSGLTDVHISNLESWCKISFSDNPFSSAYHIFLNGEEIKELVIPNSLSKISSYAFAGCSGLTSVTTPNSVTSIDGYAFSGCSGLTTVTISNSVTSIGGYAFAGCSSLTTITIGNGLRSMMGMVFSDCPKLTDVFCYAEYVPQTPSNVFNGSNTENATLHVPAASIDAYKSTAPWSGFKSIVKIDMPRHILTYMVDGEVYKTYEIEEGTKITPEPTPTKDCYTFSGWSEIPETMPAHDVTITGKFIRVYNIGDVTGVVNCIMNANVGAGELALYDINNDGELNIGDIILIVKWILNNTNNSRNKVRRRADGIMDLRQYTAAQFEIKLPTNINVHDIHLVNSMNQSHQIMYKQLDAQTYAVVVYSLTNQLMVPDQNNIVEIETEGLSIENLTIQNATFAKPNGEIASYERFFVSTGVESVQNDENHAVIYDLKGNRFDNGNRQKKGIYIINGKKVAEK